MTRELLQYKDIDQSLSRAMPNIVSLIKQCVSSNRSEAEMQSELASSLADLPLPASSL